MTEFLYLTLSIVCVVASNAKTSVKLIDNPDEPEWGMLISCLFLLAASVFWYVMFVLELFNV